MREIQRKSRRNRPREAGGEGAEPVPRQNTDTRVAILYLSNDHGRKTLLEAQAEFKLEDKPGGDFE